MAATTQRLANAVDEVLFHNDAVSLCLLVNRRHRNLRVIDFRAGPTLAKRNFVIAAAKREGVEKVYVLVERDEVNTWMRLGLKREGSIPGFYRRSDAWIMGAVVNSVGPLLAESVYDDDELDREFDEPSDALEAVNVTIERAAKRLKEKAAKSEPAVKLGSAKRDSLAKALAAAVRSGRALSGFEAFSRDGERVNLLASGRAGFELYCSYELQASFGSAIFDLLVAPKDEAERVQTQAVLRALGARLVEAGATNAFTIVPGDDIELTAALLACGFRKSAVLESHLVVGDSRVHGVVWSRRLVGEN